MIERNAISTAAAPCPGHDRATFETRAGGVLLRVDALLSDVVRIRVAPDGTLPEDASWVVPADVRAGRAEAWDVSDDSHVGLRTDALTLRVDRRTLATTIADQGGRTILDDAAGVPFSFEAGRFRLRKAIQRAERFVGLGDKTGPLDRRGCAFTNWTTDELVAETSDPIYKAIPFLIGVGGPAGAYGLLLDTSWRSSFDVGASDPDTLLIGADGGALDYYVIAGATVAHVVQRYAELSGFPPLPPKWALGYQQSRYSYMNAEAVRSVAARLRCDRFPADVIWLDIDFQDRNRPFTTDPRSFPDLPGLVADLRAQGFRTVVITDLHVPELPGEGYAPYDSGVAADAFIRAAEGEPFVGEVWPGRTLFPDFARADVRHWWGDLYTGFVNAGIAGFWNDMNEPSVFNTPDKTVPADAVQRIDTPGFAPRVTTHAELHNLTGLLNARATHEGLLRLRPDERPFVMTRATFAGGQRWAVTWTGDNDATWSQLELGVRQTLNLGLSGFAYTAVDIGGFLGTPSPDLLTRWFQVGAFMPVFRDHTAEGTPPQEPWVHGPEHEAIRRRFVEERYRLMPYFYALADEAARTGAPLVRPLFYDDPALLETASDGESFTLGRGLLVIVPLRPGAAEPRTVTLPRGRWFDYWTDAEVRPERGSKVIVTGTAPLEHLPVYVRSGTILPRQALVQSLADVPEGPLDLDIWPGPDCRCLLYDDDGHSLAHRRGEYLRQEVACAERDGALHLSFSARQGSWQPPWCELRLTVHIWTGAAARLTDGHRSFDAAVDPTQRTACFVIPAPQEASLYQITA